MKKKTLLLCALAASCTLTSVSGGELKKAWQTIAERTVFDASVHSSHVKKLLSAQKPDGSWPDIRYQDTTGDKWDPSRHLANLRILAAAYRKKADPGILDAIERGMTFWGKGAFLSSNWWQQQIGTPIALSRIFFLLGDQTSPSMLASAKLYFERAGFDQKSTGQNRIWMATIQLYRGIFYDEPERANLGRGVLNDAIVRAEPGKEGLQADGAYHQHGPQLQFGNYGRHFFVDNVSLVQLLDGTSLALAPEKAALLADYWSNGVRWVIHRGNLDLNACGRYVGIGTEKRLGEAYQKAVKVLRKVRPDCPESEITSGTKYFASSDFLVHRRPDYYVSLRMCSARVIGSETVGRENLQGRLMGNGMIQIRRDNQEYRDIPQFWNWRRLPGITAPQKGGTEELRCPGCWKKEAFYNESGLVGGLSCNGMAVTMQELKHGNFQAKKTAFFLDRYLVFLGSSISAGSATTINSCFFRGPVVIFPESAGNGPGRLHGVKSILHDNVEYLFPDGCEAELEPFERTGRWSEVIGYLSSRNARGKLFTLTIPHEKEGDGYFYVVRPVADDGSKADFKRLKTSSPEIHAIADSVSGTVLAAFYVPGSAELPDGKRLKMDNPCCAILRNGKLLAAEPGKTAVQMNFPVGKQKGETENERR